MQQSPTPSPPTRCPSPRRFPDEWADVGAFNRLARADPAFRAFALDVYGYLDRLPPGRALRLTGYSGQKLEWIVRTACAFLAEGTHWLEYRFADDLSALIHERHCPRYLFALRAILRFRALIDAPAHPPREQ